MNDFFNPIGNVLTLTGFFATPLILTLFYPVLAIYAVVQLRRIRKAIEARTTPPAAAATAAPVRGPAPKTAGAPARTAAGEPGSPGAPD